MAKKIRVGIIGCGRVSGHHANMMKDIEELHLISVCDLQEDRAKQLAEAHKVPYYTNYHRMLRSEEIDVVSIITPSGMHPYHGLDIIRRYKKHLIIEKPIVLNLDDADRLHEAATESGVRIYPIYQNRYNKAVQRLRKAIDGGEFGKISLGSVRVLWCRPQHYYDRDPWRGTWSMDGGALTNQGIHYIDLLQWLVGEVESVQAIKGTQLVNIEVEDTIAGSIKFKNGAMGTIEITTAARPKDFQASIMVTGENGTGILAGIATNELIEFTMNPDDCRTHSEVFPTVYGFGHRLLLQNVALDLLGNKTYPISMDDAMKAIRLLNAIYASAEQNKTVYLKDYPKSALLGRPDQKLIDYYSTPL